MVSISRAEARRVWERARRDPVFWVKEINGTGEPWGKQVEILYSVRDNPRTVVRSCNGAGKTFTAARVVGWFLTTHPYSIVLTTAPTGRQVKEVLWQEIARMHAQSKVPLGGRLLTTSWTIGPKWFGLGLATNEPDRFQGFHAEHILVVMDEGAGVDPMIYEAVEAVLTSEGGRLLVIGNPTEPAGPFYDAFRSPLYNKIHISAFDTPNFQGDGIVMPSLITPQWAEARKIEWGEHSPAYRARVLGEFPDAGADTLIPLSWVAYAMENDDIKEGLPVIMGVDVARFGDDDSVVAVRRGNRITRLEVFHHIDTVELAREVARIADKEKPSAIAVDADGYGAGVADSLRDWGYTAIDIHFGERAYEHERYFDRRMEMWYSFRERLRTRSVALPYDDVLMGELTSPTYSFDARGRYRLERKEDMKKRGVKSPDRADAVVLAFYMDEPGSPLVARNEWETGAPPKKGTVAELLKQLSTPVEEEYTWATR